MRILLILERTILFNRIPKNYQFLLSITIHILYFFNIVFLKISSIEIDKEIKVRCYLTRENSSKSNRLEPTRSIVSSYVKSLS